MDQSWVDLILRAPRTVPLEVDYCGQELREAELATRQDIRGVVIRVDQVSVRFVMDSARNGFSAFVTHGGEQHSVSSLYVRQPHDGDIAGWIVRVRG